MLWEAGKLEQDGDYFRQLTSFHKLPRFSCNSKDFAAQMFKATVVLVFVLIPIVARTSTTYLLLGKITRKIYVGHFLVVVQYFPLTKLSPW